MYRRASLGARYSAFVEPIRMALELERMRSNLRSKRPSERQLERETRLELATSSLEG